MTLLIEDDGPVRTILLNRPEAMNALSLQLRWDLCDAIQAARSDDSVRVIIMSGVGSRAFCVGLDLKELAARGDASAILGAEIFEVGLNAETGDVTYRIHAASRPRALLARIGYPIARVLQARFRRDSVKAMRRELPVTLP